MFSILKALNNQDVRIIRFVARWPKESPVIFCDFLCSIKCDVCHHDPRVYWKREFILIETRSKVFFYLSYFGILHAQLCSDKSFGELQNAKKRENRISKSSHLIHKSTDFLIPITNKFSKGNLLFGIKAHDITMFISNCNLYNLSDYCVMWFKNKDTI